MAPGMHQTSAAGPVTACALSPHLAFSMLQGGELCLPVLGQGALHPRGTDLSETVEQDNNGLTLCHLGL
jgi:hypothetical protein